MEVKQDFHKQKTTPWPWQVSCSTLHTVLLEDAICQGFLEYRARCNNIPYPLSSWPLLNAQGCSGQMLIWQIFHSQEDFSAILPKSVGVTWGREFPLPSAGVRISAGRVFLLCIFRGTKIFHVSPWNDSLIPYFLCFAHECLIQRK